MEESDKYLSVYQAKRLRKVIPTTSDDASCFWWRISKTNIYRFSTLEPHETLQDFYKTFGKGSIIPTYNAKELFKKLPKSFMYGKYKCFLSIRKGVNGQIEIEYRFINSISPWILVKEKTLIRAIYLLIINYHYFIYYNDTKV